MAVYVMGDVHGEYEKFADLLSQIGLQDDDTLYVMGDVLDRGPHPVKVLLKLMEMPNAFCLLGNHELMALECLPFLMQEITEESVKKLDEETIGNILSWERNGSGKTLKEFRALSREEQQDVMDYLGDFLIYEELNVAGKDYLMVHAGLGNFYPGKDIEDYSLKELIWDRAEYDITYYPDRYVITGHTPTQMIAGNPRPGYIYRTNNHIAIDCGAHRRGGRLAAICLESGEEYYSYTHGE